MKLFSDRSAQMEMIGLVIIVILITIGILFMAQFALKETPAKKIFTRKGLATSTMSAIMKTTVSDCSDSGEAPRIEIHLIEDCAIYRDVLDYSRYRCGGRHTCEFLREFISERLAESLGTWDKRYEFSSKVIGDTDPLFPDIESKWGGCPATKDRDTSSPYPLNIGGGFVESTLYICD